MRARGNDGTPAATKTKRGPAVLHLSVAERIARGKAARDQLDALELLTHVPGESYAVYVRRIVEAPGPAGRLARLVKLADLDDHLAARDHPVGRSPVCVGAEAPARNREWSDVSQERRVSRIESRVKRLTRAPVAVGNVVTLIVIVCGTTRST